MKKYNLIGIKDCDKAVHIVIIGKYKFKLSAIIASIYYKMKFDKVIIQNDTILNKIVIKIKDNHKN